MHSDTIAAYGALIIYLVLNLAFVLGLRAGFPATFRRFGLLAVARGYGYMTVFCIVAAVALASERANIAGDFVALLLVLLPLVSSVVLLACLLCAWRGWLTFRALAAAALLLGLACIAIVGDRSLRAHVAVILGASLLFAVGFKHGERPALA
ncbi:MAG: hypothetical protein WKG03_16475 [Telluria sp.]